VASETSSPARFTPLQPASRTRRILAFVVGPLLWLVAVVFVSVVVEHTRAIGIGLLVTLAAFVLSLGISVLARRLRLREERDAEPT
jgi:hypothetical protein